MRRALVVLLLLVALLGAGPAVATGDPVVEDRPGECSVTKNGRLPTCVQNSDGTWTVTYDGSGAGSATGWAGIFLILAMIGTGVFVWRASSGSHQGKQRWPHRPPPAA